MSIESEFGGSQKDMSGSTSKVRIQVVDPSLQRHTKAYGEADVEPMSESVLAPDQETADILRPEAVFFLQELESRFGERRRQLLQKREETRYRISQGEMPDFPPDTANIRTSDWKVADAPADLMDRRVEITGPAEPKMMINALNSGARVFMADQEDSISPTWENMIRAQIALKQAVRRTLSFQSADGREYALNERLATLVVRPRGWHLQEKHLLFDGQPLSASLVDFGLFFFHNAKELIRRGSGPYFYLPKLESYLEARLWNDVFIFAQESLGIPRGTIRATVLIETIHAAFQMEEILFELREHASGLNAGRWDYLFSMIKTFARFNEVIFPDRSQLTMTVPFMRAYTKLLVATCHKRDAHAIGGMSAFIPSRRNSEINRLAIQKVVEDKERESSDGFDGTWVAHPDLVPVAEGVFSSHLGERPHQKDSFMNEGLSVTERDLLPAPIEGATVTAAGISNNIEVAIEYLSSWLQGQGAVAIHNLMEDTATAEIARAQLWQWVKLEVTLSEGVRLTSREFSRRVDAERRNILARVGSQTNIASAVLDEACFILKRLVFSEEFPEFLTLAAYDSLDKWSIVRTQNRRSQKASQKVNRPTEVHQ